MKPSNSIQNILIILSRSLQRFPITILCSTAVAILLIAILDLQQVYTQAGQLETLYKTTMIIALGIPLSLCIKVFLEKKDNIKTAEVIGLYAAGGLVFLLYYFSLLDKLNMVSITRYIAVSLALYLGFLFIPYLPKKEQFEMYIIKVCSSFFITVIYSAVLYLGLAAILLAIDLLLGIDVTENAYFYIWFLVAFVFAPSYFLAGIPLPDEQLQQEKYPKILRILLLYIVMPLLTAYTAILYIYFIKIIVLWKWPVGVVSHLVLWYAVIVTAVLFFITPIKDEDKWADRFTVWMPKIILPLLIMMFISMGIRINAYGVTENRYYVIVLGLWVCAMMIYFTLTKKRRNIVIPVTLALIALLSVFGPLSSYSISTRSQNNRLQAILIKNDMLQDGKIQTAPADISRDDKYEISRKLDYFNRNHSLQEIGYLPQDFMMDDMEKVFGFPYISEFPHEQPPDDTFHLVNSQAESALDIRGYDFLFNSMHLYDEWSADSTGTIDTKYDRQSSIVRVYHQGTLLYQKNLNLFTKELFDKYIDTEREKYLSSEREKYLSPEEITLVEENEKVKVKIVFLNIMGSEKIATGDIKLEGGEFYLLVKLK